jgi:hypothetical protein
MNLILKFATQKPLLNQKLESIRNPLQVEGNAHVIQVGSPILLDRKTILQVRRSMDINSKIIITNLTHLLFITFQYFLSHVEQYILHLRY